MLVDLSVVEQKYQAVLAVIADGRPVAEVAQQWGVSRQSVHAWLARYEAAGLDGLRPRSHHPSGCPHQMSAEVEATVLEMRRAHPGWVRGGFCTSWRGWVWIGCRRGRGSTARWCVLG
jgi:transposase